MLCIAIPAVADPEVSSSHYDHTEELQTLIDFVHHEEFDSALKIAGKFTQIYPSSPVGYFYEAAIYDTILGDYRDRRFEVPFNVAVNRAIDLSNKLLEQATANGEPADPWTYFYLGGALGFRGLYKFLNNDYFGAFYDGLAAVNHLKKCQEQDSQLYDIYYGLGCFYYWTSAKSRMLWFLPFVSDKRQMGIEQLITAVRKGLYTGVEAQYALLRVYNNEKMYDNTLVFAQTLLEKFPRDIFCLNEMSYAYRQMQQWDNVIQTEQKIIDRCMAIELHCFERIAQSSLFKAEAFVKLKDPVSLKTEHAFVTAERNRRAEAGEQITIQADRYINQIEKLVKRNR
jgi:tetratricopeptide (TPR) repeat protein